MNPTLTVFGETEHSSFRVVDLVSAAVFNPWILLILVIAMTVIAKRNRSPQQAWQWLKVVISSWLPVVLFVVLGMFLLQGDFAVNFFETRLIDSWKGDIAGVDRDHSRLSMQNVVGQNQSYLTERSNRWRDFYPIAVLIVIGQLVVASACLFYALHISKLMIVSAYKDSAISICWFVILTAGAWVTYVVLSVLDPELGEYSRDKLVHHTEYISLVQFGLFVMIDHFVVLAIPESSLAECTELGEKIQLASARQLAKDATWFVDIPCFFGVVFIVMLHEAIHEVAPQSGVYLAQGISAGAIAFHVAITQVIFGVLSFREACECSGLNGGGE